MLYNEDNNIRDNDDAALAEEYSLWNSIDESEKRRRTICTRRFFVFEGGFIKFTLSTPSSSLAAGGFTSLTCTQTHTRKRTHSCLISSLSLASLCIKQPTNSHSKHFATFYWTITKAVNSPAGGLDPHVVSEFEEGAGIKTWTPICVLTGPGRKDFLDQTRSVLASCCQQDSTLTPSPLEAH